MSPTLSAPRRRASLRSRAWPTLLIGACLLAAPPAVADLELYRPRHRPALELEAIAAELLRPDGAAIADPTSGTLLLRGPAPALAETLAALRTLDVAPTRYRIEARWAAEEELRALGLELSGWLTVGHLRVSTLVRSGSDARGLLRSLGTESSEDWLATLIVLDGRFGEIWTGSLQPVHFRRLEEADDAFRIHEITPLLPVRTGLRVRPRQQPDGTLELEIVAARQEPGPYGPIVISEISTTLRLEPGQAVAVADLRERWGSGPAGVWTAAGDRHSHGSVLWLRISRADSDPRP